MGVEVEEELGEILNSGLALASLLRWGARIVPHPAGRSHFKTSEAGRGKGWNGMKHGLGWQVELGASIEAITRIGKMVGCWATLMWLVI